MTDRYDLVLLPGDGVGTELLAEGRRVLDGVARHTGVGFDVEELPCGAEYFLEHGKDWPDGSAERCERADAILLGAIGRPAAGGRGTVMRPDGKMAGWSAIVGNRQRLDLYANIRPVKLLPGVLHSVSGRHKPVWEPQDVDMVFFRENTEGLYAGSGGILAPGGHAQVATDTRVITRASSERIIRRAFEAAERRSGAPGDGRKRVTCVVKDNILHGCRLFVSVFDEVGAEYPGIEREVMLVDAFSQWLIRRPEQYDVVVATNMFGDIITEIAAVLQGGLGMAVGCNVGDRHGMFEPIHGSAPKHVGRNRLNPMATILAVAEMLGWLGERREDGRLTRAAVGVRAAVADVVAEGRVLTYDLVGEEKAASTTEVTTAVIEALSRRMGTGAA